MALNIITPAGIALFLAMGIVWPLASEPTRSGSFKVCARNCAVGEPVVATTSASSHHTKPSGRLAAQALLLTGTPPAALTSFTARVSASTLVCAWRALSPVCGRMTPKRKALSSLVMPPTLVHEAMPSSFWQVLFTQVAGAPICAEQLTLPQAAVLTTGQLLSGVPVDTVPVSLTPPPSVLAEGVSSSSLPHARKATVAVVAAIPRSPSLT